MKNTGMVRTLDMLGRLVLPKELRNTMGLESGSGLQIYTEGDSIVLKPNRIACSICGEQESEELARVNGHCICHACAKEALYGRRLG